MLQLAKVGSVHADLEVPWERGVQGLIHLIQPMPETKNTRWAGWSLAVRRLLTAHGRGYTERKQSVVQKTLSRA